MTKIKKVDEKASITQGKELFKNYRRLSRMAGIKLTDPETPQLETIPLISNDQAEPNQFDPLNIVSEINKAMLLLSDISLNVLFYTYCSSTKLTHYQISAKVGYAEGSIDKMLKIALTEFIECYKNGELLVYK